MADLRKQGEKDPSELPYVLPPINPVTGKPKWHVFVPRPRKPAIPPRRDELSIPRREQPRKLPQDLEGHRAVLKQAAKFVPETIDHSISNPGSAPRLPDIASLPRQEKHLPPALNNPLTMPGRFPETHAAHDTAAANDWKLPSWKSMALAAVAATAVVGVGAWLLG